MSNLEKAAGGAAAAVKTHSKLTNIAGSFMITENINPWETSVLGLSLIDARAFATAQRMVVDDFIALIFNQHTFTISGNKTERDLLYNSCVEIDILSQSVGGVCDVYNLRPVNHTFVIEIEGHGIDLVKLYQNNPATTKPERIDIARFRHTDGSDPENEFTVVTHATGKLVLQGVKRTDTIHTIEAELLRILRPYLSKKRESVAASKKRKRVAASAGSVAKKRNQAQ